MNDSPKENPYQSPADVDDYSFAPGPGNSVSLLRYRRTLQSFRILMHILGGFWVFIGGIALFGGAMLLAFDGDPVLVVIIFIAGIMWLGLGIPTCLKQMWAVYVGLVLSYLSAISNLLQGSLCSLAIVVPTIVIAHIAISKAGQLRRVGILPNARPSALQSVRSDPFAEPNFDYLEIHEPQQRKIDPELP